MTLLICMYGQCNIQWLTQKVKWQWYSWTGNQFAPHPHETVDQHHPSSIHSLLYELGHNREVFANVGLGTVWQLQAQELDVQSLLKFLSLFTLNGLPGSSQHVGQQNQPGQKKHLSLNYSSANKHHQQIWLSYKFRNILTVELLVDNNDV